MQKFSEFFLQKLWHNTVKVVKNGYLADSDREVQLIGFLRWLYEPVLLLLRRGLKWLILQNLAIFSSYEHRIVLIVFENL